MYNKNMITRAIRNDEENHEEWQFGHGFSDYKKEQQQINQDIYTALYEFKYDCFFALQNGIDWYSRLGYKNQKELLDNDVQTLINSRYGVLSISDFESSVIDRHYTCTCVIYTIYSGQEGIDFNFSI